MIFGTYCNKLISSLKHAVERACVADLSAHLTAFTPIIMGNFPQFSIVTLKRGAQRGDWLMGGGGINWGGGGGRI